MGILSKYLCKEFIKLFALCQAIFIFIYLLIDFLQKIDNFIGAHVPMTAMWAYFFYKIPYISIQMVPVAVLISVIMLFSSMKKNNEIIALKCGGMSSLKISLPVLVVSMVLSVAVFLFSELAVPYFSSKCNDIWDREVNKKDQRRFYGRSHIWFKGDNVIYWIRHFDEKKMVMEDPAFYFFDKSFLLIKKINAQRASWIGDGWQVEEGIIQKSVKGGAYDLERFKEINLKLTERPEAFLRTIKRPEEMSYWELKRYAKKVGMEGYDETRFLVDMNIKLAFPLVGFVMILMGIPIALGPVKGGTPLAISIGIAACFLYLLTLGLSRSLGLSGVLPPFLSAWLANAIFFFSGVYMLMRLDY